MDDPSQTIDHQTNQDARDSRRYGRLAEYQEKAVKNADPLLATLAVVNSDLMTFAFRLSQAIDGAVGEGAASLQELQRVAPDLNAYLRIAKQIDRFTQLGINLGKSERSVVATTSSKKKRVTNQAKNSRVGTHSKSPTPAARRRK